MNQNERMEMEQAVRAFWPVWAGRVLWLLVTFAAVAYLTGGLIPSAVWALMLLAATVHFVLFILARRQRLPRWHTWASAIPALALAMIVWLTVPQSQTTLLFLVPLIILDVAQFYGIIAALLFLIFPFLPAFLFAALRQPLNLDPILWGTWAIATFVGILLVRPRPTAPPQAPLTRGELLQGVLANTIQLLTEVTSVPQIYAILLRGGLEILDYQRPRQTSKAMILTFRTDVTDKMEVRMVYNMEQNQVGRDFEMRGALDKFVKEEGSEPISFREPPFDKMKPLRDHRILLYPLNVGVDLYGAVLFATKDEGRAQDKEVRTLLRALTQQASLVIHNRVLQEVLGGKRERHMDDESAMRHQLARDLHDGPVQKVAAVAMQLDFVKMLMERDASRAGEELNKAQGVAKLAAQEMRTFLFTLRPVVLERSGLSAAVEALVDRLRDHEKANIRLDADPLPRLDGKVEDTAYAILQEAIGNARKYSDGAPIQVRLIHADSMIVGQVEDKGPGFDLQRVTASYGTRASLGLLNMQERARLIEGQVKIDTAPGKGTVVSLAIPVNS